MMMNRRLSYQVMRTIHFDRSAVRNTLERAKNKLFNKTSDLSADQTFSIRNPAQSKSHDERKIVKTEEVQVPTNSEVKFNTEHRKDFFDRILQRFPQSGNELIFAYGSGVFDQAGRANEKNKVTDLILIVEDSCKWHGENLKLNPKDYSMLFRAFGPKMTADTQDNFGASMFFNTLIPFESGLIKYGVASKSTLMSDCLDWDHLYLSGRLHKPVRILSMNSEQKSTLRLNLQSALHTALTLLPETFSEERLYTTLAGLSYAGDFRMVVGEDRNKVANIVRPNIHLFRKLYANRLTDLSDYLNLVLSRGRIDQDISPSARHFHMSQLPKTLQWNLVLEWNHDGRYRDVEDVLRSAAYDRDSGALVENALHKIVRKSSLTQAAKGILTAGPIKTVKYSWAKLVKMYNSLNKK